MNDNKDKACGALTCTTTVYNTVGKGTCTGSGYWKLKVACQAQTDKTTSRIHQNGGTVNQYAECTFKATSASVIIG